MSRCPNPQNQTALNEYLRGDSIGLQVIVAWLIDQGGFSEAFKDRFGGTSFDALLQEFAGGGNVSLQYGFRDSIEQTSAWLTILGGHKDPPA